MTARVPVVCSIGSTDPTAASGIGVDLKVYQRLGVLGVFAIAAVTAQNAKRVSKLEYLAPLTITRQLEAVWSETLPDSIRIGLLPDTAGIGAVLRFLRGLRQRPPIVLDPVLASTSGTRFSGAAEIAALRRLLPLVTLVTPNLAEAAELSGAPVRTLPEARQAARLLAQSGCATLVKGGHLRGARSVDVFCSAGHIRSFSSARVNAGMRGKGCILAAAIASHLARGSELQRAVRRGRAFLRAMLREAGAASGR